MSGYRENAKLTAYALGELGQRESKGMGRDVAGCEVAREAADEIIEVAALLREEFASEPGLFLTTEQREAILRGESSLGDERSEGGSAWDAAAEAEIGGAKEVVAWRGIKIDGRGWFLGGLGTAAAAALVVAFMQVTAPVGGVVSSAGEEKAMEVTIAEIPDQPGLSGLAGDVEGEGTSVLWRRVEAVDEVVLDYEIPGEVEGAGLWSLAGRANAVAGLGVAVGEVGESELLSGRVTMPQSLEPFAFSAPLGRERAVYELGGNYWIEPDNLIPSSGRGAVVGSGSAGVIAEGTYSDTLSEPLSVIPLSYDPSSYANLRHFVIEHNLLPPKRLVSLGDLVNHFDYGYLPPARSAEDAVRTSIEVADCPWAPGRLLVRVGIKAKRASDVREKWNVALILDTSKSMLGTTKLPVIVDSIDAMLDSMNRSGRVAVISFGGSFGFHLDPTLVSNRANITGAVEALASGIGDADQEFSFDAAVTKAREVFNGYGGVDQVVVVTDSLAARRLGDRSLPGSLQPLKKSASRLAVVGVGSDILGERALLNEVGAVSDFHYAGTVVAGSRAFEQIGRSGSETVVARRVTADVEFNPQAVVGYRLLASVGDAGVEGSATTNLNAEQEVTALYEVSPMGKNSLFFANKKRPLKYDHLAEELREYASAAGADGREFRDELMTVRVSYQNQGGGGGSRAEVSEVALANQKVKLSEASNDFRFAVAVAGYGMLLSGYSNVGDFDFGDIVKLARGAVSSENDRHGMREEFLELLHASAAIMGR